MRRLILSLLIIIICVPAFAKDFARRFPSDTPMEVYTPNSYPPGAYWNTIQSPTGNQVLNMSPWNTSWNGLASFMWSGFSKVQWSGFNALAFSGVSVTSDSNIYTSANVGIGSASPSSALEIGSGGSIKLSGGSASGQGSIQFGATPSASFDTNLIDLDSTDKTGGFIFGNTPAFSASNGPYFGARGNTYSAITTQRGLMFFSAGYVSSPTLLEGCLMFSTGNNATRMLITPAGNVGLGGLTDPTTITEVLTVNGNIQASGYKSSDGSAGITTTQTFKDGSGATKTMTIKNGLITNIS